jgi:ribosome-associated heat shock protein Hsp15
LAGPGTGKGSRNAVPQRQTLRLDKWLWQARFFKSRGLAAEVVERGHLRVNGQRHSKPGFAVGEGDVLTFPQGGRIRVVRVLALGDRRGPASEAQTLYLDLDPRPAEAEAPDDIPSATPSPLE